MEALKISTIEFSVHEHTANCKAGRSRAAQTQSKARQSFLSTFVSDIAYSVYKSDVNIREENK